MRQKFSWSQVNQLFLTVVVSLFVALPIFAGRDFSIQETFQTHCVECHGAKGKVKGDVNLVSYSEGEDIKEDLELLQTVMEVIDPP